MSDEQACRAQIESFALDVVNKPQGRLGAVLVPVVAGFALWLVFVATGVVWRPWPRAYQMLFERGVWQYVTLLLAFLVVTDLAWRVLLGWGSRFRPARLQWPASGQLRDEQIVQIASALRQCHFASWPTRLATWSRSLALALLQYARGEPKSTLREAQVVQAQADESSLASRYAPVKLYLWAIPLIGFIGTVEGIGSGIGEFSLNLQAQSAPVAPAPGADSDSADAPVSDRMENVRKSLENVTSGLGRAFDTTYLALVLTVVLMLATSVLERRETDRQSQFHEFLQTDFVGRLAEARPPSFVGGMPTAGSTEQLLAAAAQTHELTTRLESLRDQLQSAVGNGGIACTISLGKQPE